MIELSRRSEEVTTVSVISGFVSSCRKRQQGISGRIAVPCRRRLRYMAADLSTCIARQRNERKQRKKRYRRDAEIGRPEIPWPQMRLALHRHSQIEHQGADGHTETKRQLLKHAVKR